MGFVQFLRRSVVCVLVAGAVLSGGCALIGLPNYLDIASGGDAEEGYAVWRHVKYSEAVPESASVGRSQTGSRRFVKVVGVEDRATQEEIVEITREAWRLHSTEPVVLIFYAGLVVKDRPGHPGSGATYPEGTREIRRVIFD